MKGCFTVSKTGRRIFIGGVFLNPGETSGVIEIPKTQIDWILAKIRDREVSFTPFAVNRNKKAAEPVKPIALPMKKGTNVVERHKKVALDAVPPSVTQVDVMRHKEPTFEVEEKVVETEDIIVETEEVAVAEEVIIETEEVVEVTEEEVYNEEEKREEYKSLYYNQLYGRCRAFNVEVTGRPKKDELIELLISAKV
jgi:hypothetical protein